MLYRARSLSVPLIDATPVVMAVHQNHDYSHHPQGKEGLWNGDEQLANAKLAGGADAHIFTFRCDAFAYAAKAASNIRSRHLLRRCETLPILYPWLPLRLASESARYVPARCGPVLG